MHHIRLLTAASLAAAISIAMPPGAIAQQGPNWFVPGGGQQQQQHRPAPAQARPGAAARSAPRQPAQMVAPPAASLPLQPPPGVGAEPPAPPMPLAQFQLPPEPSLPPVPKGSAPPAAVIGVLGVPEIMRACAAAQEVERVIGERRQKLNDDAQKEQAAWRDLQQQLVSQRSTLTPDQIRTKERELQERITNAQRQFRERNRVIQEAAQFALAQIERTLVAVIRQVAESRGMNLVLHRNQVALNVNEFDLTEQVATQLNKILPTVVIPADGKEPPTIPLAQGSPTPSSVAPASTGPAPAGNPAGAGGASASAPAPAAPAPAAQAPAGQQKP